MRVLRVVWRFIKTVFGVVVTIVRTIYNAIATVIEGFVYPPLEALWRVVWKLVRRLWDLVLWVLQRWSNIWSEGPATPRTRIPTPGISGIPLTASATTTILWYTTPLHEALGLSGLRFFLAMLVTWIGVFLLVRRICRAERPGRISQWLISVEYRPGLLGAERLSAVLMLAAVFVALRFGSREVFVPLMGLISFLILLSSEYEARELSDSLPTIEPGSDDPAGGAPDGEPFIDPSAALDPDRFVIRHFAWEHDVGGRSRAASMSVVVDVEKYKRLQSINPKAPPDSVNPDFSPWVIGGHSAEVERSALALRDVARSQGLSAFEEILLTVGFVQSVEYSSDEVTTGHVEYWRYPIETLHDETGDCEDTTILAAAVLRQLGHEVLPLVTRNHAALAIAAPRGLPGHFIQYDGQSFYYCETTSVGFELGHLPDDISPDDLIICPLR